MKALTVKQVGQISGGVSSEIANKPLGQVTLSELLEEGFSFFTSSEEEIVAVYPWMADYLD